MDTIQLQMKTNIGTTSVSNLFIDAYMPSANGSYVKVYLYLLRCLSEHKCCSLSDLADQLEDSEKEILRALKYWKKMNLIEIQTNDQNQLTQITFLNPEEKETACTLELAPDEETTAAVPKVESSEDTTPSFHAPVRKVYTPNQVDELRQEKEINGIFNIVEIYRNGRLQTKDIQLIPYLYVDLGFSSDLITYLYEYCLSIEKGSPAYIEKVALSWAENNICTVAQAEATLTTYHENYKVVTKAFGLNRPLAAIEKQYIDEWYRYGFSPELVTIACDRTVLNTNRPDFKYANSIIMGWHKQGAYTIEQVEALDQKFKGKHKESPATSKTSNKFQSFPQRDYSHDEYSSLEQQLLGK